MKFTPAQLDDIWEADKTLRKSQIRRRDYYDGIHDITLRKETYPDGKKKTNRVANWARYGVHRYVGALTGSPYQLTYNDEVADKAALDLYGELSDKQELPRQEAENLRNALVCGYGIELHEFSADDGIRIVTHDPREWALVWDSDDELCAAVRRVVLTSGTVHNKELLIDDLEIMTLYTADEIVDYSRIYSASPGDWTEDKRTTHHYERVPVVVWTINKERESILTDDLLGQIDEYDEIDSMSGDDIRAFVDAIMVIRGVDPGWLENPKNVKLITENRILPMGSKIETDADYLTRVIDSNPIIERLKRTLDIIHMELECPNIEQITGATGSTTGIALKLKFTPMQQRAAQMMLYLESSLRDRVALINAMWQRASKTAIEDFTVNIQFTLPINLIEEWKAISSLDNQVSHRTRLELLHSIKDPERELAALEEERDKELDDQESVKPVDEVSARTEGRVAKATENIQGATEQSSDAIASGLNSAAKRSGILAAARG